MKNLNWAFVLLIYGCGGTDHQLIEGDAQDRTPPPEQYLTADVNGRSWRAIPPILAMYNIRKERRIMFGGADTLDHSMNGFHLTVPLPVGMDTTAHVTGDHIRFNTDTCNYDGSDMLVTVSKVFRGHQTYVMGTFSGTLQDSHRRHGVLPITVTNGRYCTMGMSIDSALR